MGEEEVKDPDELVFLDLVEILPTYLHVYTYLYCFLLEYLSRNLPLFLLCVRFLPLLFPLYNRAAELVKKDVYR